jgi:hypothetical protein
MKGCAVIFATLAVWLVGSGWPDLIVATVLLALLLGCTWTSPSARRVGERIELLGRPSLSRRAAFGGASVVAVIGLVLGYAARAQQPERVVTQTARPKAVWTRTADAPQGVMSHAFEGQRHDLFIELAQKGGIDLVFFGTTETEMWWWKARSRAVWDREYAWRKAQNFGSQGTSAKTLLWRMQNGELDGYEAKLVVLQLGLGGRIADPFNPKREPEFLAGWSSVLAEIRARRPQAKILLWGRSASASSRPPTRSWPKSSSRVSSDSSAEAPKHESDSALGGTSSAAIGPQDAVMRERSTVSASAEAAIRG